MSEAKRYRLVFLPWRAPETRFALVRPSARRPGDYEVAAFRSEEEAELWCCASGIWDDVEVLRPKDDAAELFAARGRKRRRA